MGGLEKEGQAETLHRKQVDYRPPPSPPHPTWAAATQKGDIASIPADLSQNLALSCLHGKGSVHRQPPPLPGTSSQGSEPTAETGDRLLHAVFNHVFCHFIVVLKSCSFPS